MSPAPIPVPNVRNTMFSVPRPAPYIHSARAQAFASLQRLASSPVLSLTTIELFDKIALSRGFKLKGNQIDYSRTAKMIIDEFRKGKLGKIMLEIPKN